MTKTIRLLVIAIGIHALLLAGCTRKCLPGYVMRGNACVSIGSIADSGTAQDAMAADSSKNDGGAATETRKGEAQKKAAVSTAGTSAPATDAGPKASTSESTTMAAAGAPAAGSGSTGNASSAETCDTEGATRCTTRSPLGGRETCMGKVWMKSQPCADTEACVMQADGASCMQIEELCVGSDGQPVCDGQGQLLLCNTDGTLMSREMCLSPRLCKAGLASKHCPICLANEEYRCTEAALEVCAADGMSFMPHMECPSAALCSASLGLCSDAVCRPDMFTCENNVLKPCKADSSGFDETKAKPCGEGTCDAKGGDCNMCEPGQKSCMGDNVMTCDSTGQKLVASACSDNKKCFGAGQCVDCLEDTDCSSLTKNCTVGACQQHRCVEEDATAGKACTTSGRPGKCASGGECVCTPQCNKPCGDDGCGRQCPNTCGALMCVNDACVECTSSQQCDDSADGCKVGMCDRNGHCTQTSTGTEGNDCRTNGMEGTCKSGKCVATPPPPPPPTTGSYHACSSNADCTGPGENCHVSAKYCTPACGDNGSCNGGRKCLEGWCLFWPPPCPDGLNAIEIPAYNPPTGKATICAVPGGV